MSIFTLPLFVPVGPNKTKQVHLVFTVEPVGLEQPRYGDRWRIKASAAFTEFLPEMEFWDRCRTSLRLVRRQLPRPLAWVPQLITWMRLV